MRLVTVRVLVVPVVLVLAACGQGQRGRPAPPEAAAASESPTPAGTERDRWRARGSDDYAFTLRHQCYCPDSGDQRITVVDDQVVRVQALEGERPRELDRFEVTIDALFDLIERPQGVASVQAEYDSEYGYPKKIEVDVEANAIDDEYTYIVGDYSPTG